MNANINNWSSPAHQEVHKIFKHEIAHIVNQVDVRVQNFEIHFLKEATKFVRDFKSLAKEADKSLDKITCMTRSSANELFTPYKEPEPEFQSSRRHFKTLSLDELRLPDFNLLSDQEYSEEEIAKTMAETMEQYMSKTRADYGSGVARPKIKDRDNFKLKGQFLKELRTNTFSGSDHEDANEHIEKVLEIVDLFHIPNITIDHITIDQVMLRAFPMSLTGAASRWLRNKPTEMQEAVLLYNGLDVPTRQILDLRGGGYKATALRYYQKSNVNPSYQERRQSMEDTQSKFMSESVKRHEYNSNLIKEIRATTYAAIRNQGASIKTLEIQIGQMNKLILTTIEADLHSIRRIGSPQYAVSTEQNSTMLYKSRQMTVPFLSRLDDHYCEEEEGNYRPKFAEAYGASHINDTIPRKEKDPGSLGELAHTKLTVELADFIILDMPEDIKVPLILGRPFLSTAYAKIDVYKRMITLRVEEERIVFTNIINGDYIELNDLNEPFELRRNQGDDLMPTIEKGEVIEEFRTRDENLDTGIDDYPSTLRFGNDHDAVILGYEDLQWGNILIARVYFVEGLGHNLFLVGQFCDSDLEVAFRRNTCFVRNLKGVDLLKENYTINLYTINLHEMASTSPMCLMPRATSTKSWLWHQCLSHLNFDTINELVKNDLVIGLLKFKYSKEHLYPSCEQGKSKKVSHPAKAETRGVTSWISSQHNGVNNKESLHAN
ncbi:reverse transcriptase domain-containing protein [Tanacetum coccineum]